MYFEKQEDDDCSVHSFNNAAGAKVITDKEVLESIERMKVAYQSQLVELGVSEDKAADMTKEYASKLSTKKTNFTPETVWAAALSRAGVPIPVETSKDIPDGDTRRLIILGEGHENNKHAIAARGGLLYDSLSKDEVGVPVTKENLSKIYTKIDGVYELKY